MFTCSCSWSDAEIQCLAHQWMCRALSPCCATIHLALSLPVSNIHEHTCAVKTACTSDTIKCSRAIWSRCTCVYMRWGQHAVRHYQPLCHKMCCVHAFAYEHARHTAHVYVHLRHARDSHTIDDLAYIRFLVSSSQVAASQQIIRLRVNLYMLQTQPLLVLTDSRSVHEVPHQNSITLQPAIYPHTDT